MAVRILDLGDELNWHHKARANQYWMRTDGLFMLTKACQLQKVKVAHHPTATGLPQNMMMPPSPKRENTGERRNESRGPDCQSGEGSQHKTVMGKSFSV